MSSELSVDEIVAFLNHSSDKNILVEGTCDAVMIREIDHRVSACGASVLTCGGREKLLSVFERREECQSSTIVYLADRDMWYFHEVPAKYRDGVVFTDGYSIENDLYNERWVRRFISEPAEWKKFESLVEVLVTWFAAEVDRVGDGYEPRCDVSAHAILDKRREFVSEMHVKRFGEPKPKAATVAMIRASYARALRGKNLLEAVHIVMSAPERHTRWNKPSIVESLVKEASPAWAALVERLLEALQRDRGVKGVSSGCDESVSERGERR